MDKHLAVPPSTTSAIILPSSGAPCRKRRKDRRKTQKFFHHQRIMENGRQQRILFALHNHDFYSSIARDNVGYWIFSIAMTGIKIWMSKWASKEKLVPKSFFWNKNQSAENKNPVDFYSRISKILGVSWESGFQKDSFQHSVLRWNFFLPKETYNDRGYFVIA